MFVLYNKFLIGFLIACIIPYQQPEQFYSSWQSSHFVCQVFDSGVAATTSMAKMLVEATKLKMMIHGPSEISRLPQEGAAFGEKAGKTITY